MNMNSLKYAFLLTSDYMCVCTTYIYKISNQKVHIEKQASFPTYFKFSISLLRVSNCYQIILPSRPYTLSNPTFYHGFWLREKNKYLPSIPCVPGPKMCVLH